MLEIDRKRLAELRQRRPAPPPRNPTDFERGVALFPELKRAANMDDVKRVRYLEARIDELLG